MIVAIVAIAATVLVLVLAAAVSGPRHPMVHVEPQVTFALPPASTGCTGATALPGGATQVSIAAVLNEHFVSIKVDREERPDLDETYMNVVTALTGRGGWPLSVFLTPDLKPFYGGTYFPPADRGGLPGFPRLLLALSQAYHKNQEQIQELARRVIEHLHTLGEIPVAAAEPSRDVVDQAVGRLLKEYDPVHGGLGGAPKFPRALELGLILYYYHLSRDPQVLEKLGFTLEKMARGGIYDQLGGGFHRYSVDAAWVVPHFEKMLYDNALLAPIYLAHFQLSGSPLSRRVAAATLDFALSDLEAADGGFYSAWDADSEGVEGKYYVWGLQVWPRRWDQTWDRTRRPWRSRPWG